MYVMCRLPEVLPPKYPDYPNWNIIWMVLKEANHISRYICRQRSRFTRNGRLLLIGQFKERNAELERAAVSGEEKEASFSKAF